MPYNEFSVVWVVGIVDTHGAIRAREAESGIHHTPEDRLSGRPWRWCIASQDWGEVRIGSEHLSPEEHILVVDWLECNGYKAPGEFFDRKFGREWLEKKLESNLPSESQ